MVPKSLVVAVVLVAASGSAVGLTNAAPLDADATPPAVELLEGTDPAATDTDGDGLSDTAEIDGPSDPLAGDTDADGLGDGDEVTALNSSPTAVDSDGDGLEDGREVDEVGTDPAAADTDADGVADADELAAGTDPLAADTDDDGLGDGAEADRGTDPVEPDSDGDGLDDGPEDLVGTDPLAADTDGDTLADGEERRRDTDPTAADTDGDGLADGREVAGEMNARAADTDGDGLDDGAEAEYGTDPVDQDTDGDRLSDGWEVDGETPAGAPLPDADPARMDLYVAVVAEAGSSPLSADEREQVREAWARMPVENPDGSTGISVHVGEGETLEESIVYDGQFDSLYREHYDEGIDPARRDVYHQVFIARFSGDYEYVGGEGQRPGRFSVVRNDFSPYASDRYETVVHELLHNVMGELDEENQCGDDVGHSCRGWLTASGSDEFLTDGLAAEIEREGFE